MFLVGVVELNVVAPIDNNWTIDKQSCQFTNKKVNKIQISLEIIIKTY